MYSFLILLLLSLVQSTISIVQSPDLPSPTRHDRIERNTWHTGNDSGNGKESVAHQLVFWRWDDDFKRYRSCGFVIITNVNQVRVERLATREYSITVIGCKERPQRFVTPVYGVSETENDIEVADRNRNFP